MAGARQLLGQFHRDQLKNANRPGSTSSAGSKPANPKLKIQKAKRISLKGARPANAGMAPGSNVGGQPKA